MVARIVERHRPVRREYERHEVDHGVYLTAQGAIIGELANLFATAGLGHLLFWDWNLGLPKTVCLTDANGPKHTGNSGCNYIEEARVLEGTDIESGFEDLTERTSSGLAGVGLSLKLTRTSRADSAPTQWRGRINAKGRAAVDLRSVVPEDESRVLLEVLASHSRTENATYEAVIVRESGRFGFDASDAAVADAREAIRAAGQAWEAEVARREQERQRADAQKRRDTYVNGSWGYTDRICAHQADIDTLESINDRELKVAARSGFINRVTLHKNTTAIVYIEEQRDHERAAYQARFRKSFTLSRCKGWTVEAASERQQVAGAW